MYLSTTLNTGHVWGRGRETIILPVLARDEEPQATTQESMFNFVRMSDGGTAALRGGCAARWRSSPTLAERVLPAGPIDWSALREHPRIREAIAKVVPGYEAIGEIDDTRQEFQIEGRTFHEPRFATPSGRAALPGVHAAARLRARPTVSSA